MGWSAPSKNDYYLARAGLKKLQEPDDTAKVGSFWIGEKPREDSGTWEPHNSLYNGRNVNVDGGNRRTQWKKVAEPAWKNQKSTPAATTTSSSATPAPAPATASPSAESLAASASEARQRADAAQTKMRDTIPKVTSGGGIETAANFGKEMDDWKASLGDSLRQNSLQQIAETRESTFGGIRGLSAGLKLPKQLDIAALFEQYASGMG